MVIHRSEEMPAVWAEFVSELREKLAAKGIRGEEAQAYIVAIIPVHDF